MWWLIAGEIGATLYLTVCAALFMERVKTSREKTGYSANASIAPYAAICVIVAMGPVGLLLALVNCLALIVGPPK